MLRIHASTMVLLSMAVAQSASSSGPTSPLPLGTVVKLASQKVNDEDTSVDTARHELQMLEALNRTRVEFRPQLNLLSFSNPLFLAVSLGGSLSVNRRLAPSPVTLELARFAVVEAEMTRARSRIMAETSATQQFFALAEAEEQTSRTCAMWEGRVRDQSKVATLVTVNRLTKVDYVRYQQDVTALESECLEAKARRETAATSLRRVTGLLTPTAELKVMVETADAGSILAELPPAQELVSSAFSSRPDLKSVVQQLSSLTDAKERRSLHFDGFSTGYSYLKNAEKNIPNGGKQYLLGGNVGHVDAGFYIPLRNTGDALATTSFLQSRLKRLNQNLDNLRLTLLEEVQDSAQRARLSADRLRVASRQQQLTAELKSLIEEREKVGLQASSDLVFTSRDARRAEGETHRLELELKKQIFIALAICSPDEIPRLSAKYLERKGPQESEVVARSEASNDTDQIQSHRVSTPLSIQPVSFNTVSPKSQLSAYSVPVPERKPANDIHSGVTPRYLPPVPRKQVLPDAHSLGQYTLARATDISVVVSIDDEGRVLDASPAEGTPRNTVVLAQRATEAARHWTFKPAKLSGKNIPSRHSIVFRFVQGSD